MQFNNNLDPCIATKAIYVEQICCPVCAHKTGATNLGLASS